VQKESPETLPKTMPGVVCVQWVRCGRSNCHCGRGTPHGPYHYRFWRERGRLRKSYVRPADLAQTIARCQARRQMQQELKAGWETWRQMVILVREAERR
jgi:hypothetical protein